ncbi:uncharacterized protein LOC127842502 [Dreissena polymorpha]|uniref:Mab-21-like HhH/H2TH-like domain-containing protein n=1 Tax=Dreissena polymorpha TaxID=45954 RepID=A0A9D4EP92_DREPO|nr:uncharacterized protein LOC127842502 [Dreissena polymorpha]KAH3783912.1 hypothetical protein DPMN_161862 [Dreissena polymorpha]
MARTKHTPKNKRTVWKTAQYVENNSTHDKDFSEKLSRFLDSFAVNKQVTEFRRKIMYSYELEMTLTRKTLGLNRRTYIFGSQIEGTSSIGMNSDADFLQSFETFRLFLDSDIPHLQQNDHQVVIKVSTNSCATQYCVLTMIEPATQAKRFQQLDPNHDAVDIVIFFRRDWMQHDGMIPHTIMFGTLDHHLSILKQAKRHGPAKSIRNMDSVNACYCKSLPKQCKFFFERPRPGNWPSEKTLTKAKKYDVFIVPQGPPKSTNVCTYDYFDYQWRISTNLTERLLMFSLDTVHLKAYTLTKMIRKEFFVPEYLERLSTFHFKTAFFFTVENTRPDVWREDNLINCVKYIFATLMRFLKRRHCPHYTIENVNLFEGKIQIHEFQK